MRKQNAIQKLLVAISFTAFLLIGYVATEMAIPRVAQAGCIPILPTACNYAVGGVSTALLATEGNEEVAIGLVDGSLSAAFYGELAVSEGYIEAKVLAVAVKFTLWFQNFVFRKLVPNLQNMTNQLIVINAHQSKAIGKYIDASDMNRTKADYEDQEIQTHREQRVGDNTVVAGTVTGGMTRATEFERAYNAAAPAEMSGRSGNKAGVESSVSTAADMSNRWKNYTTRYCRKNDNNGASGCAEDGQFAGQDIDVTGIIFGKETIDLTNPDIKKTVDDLITNIAEPFIKNPVPASAVDSAAGHEVILEAEAYKAKRQVIYDSLYHVVARRAPGSTMGNYVRPLRLEAGIPSSAISANPSHNEIMQAMTSERYRSGKWAQKLIDEPENNKREMVIQQAFMLMQMNDQLDLMDRYSLLLAAQAGSEVRKSKTSSTAMSGAPLK